MVTGGREHWWQVDNLTWEASPQNWREWSWCMCSKQLQCKGRQGQGSCQHRVNPRPPKAKEKEALQLPKVRLCTAIVYLMVILSPPYLLDHHGQQWSRRNRKGKNAQNHRINHGRKSQNPRMESGTAGLHWAISHQFWVDGVCWRPMTPTG